MLRPQVVGLLGRATGARRKRPIPSRRWYNAHRRRVPFAGVVARRSNSMKKPVPPKPLKFPAAKQRRLDRLLDKNSEGTISAKERATLETLVAEAEEWMVANAKRLAQFSKSERVHPASGAVPVTVWVQPQLSARKPLSEKQTQDLRGLLTAEQLDDLIDVARRGGPDVEAIARMRAKSMT